MKTAVKNKIIKRTGQFICGGTGDKGCGCPITGLAKVINGYVYCLKCAEILKGIRNENGMLINQGTKYDQRTLKELDDHNAMKESSKIRG